MINFGVDIWYQWVSRGYGYRGQREKPLLRDGCFRGFSTPAYHGRNQNGQNYQY